MPEQGIPVREELEQKAHHIESVLHQREALISKIGTGEVVLGSSWEATIKVGETRRSVRDSLVRLQTELGEVKGELSVYTQAEAYEKEVALRKKQLDTIATLTTEGNLSPDILATYQQEFWQLTQRAETDETLQSGLRRLAMEREKDAGKEAPSSHVFTLPDGRKLNGKYGTLLHYLASGDKTSHELVEVLFPEGGVADVRNSLRTVVSQTRHKLASTELEVVTIAPEGGYGTGLPVTYSLRKRET